MFQKLDSNMFTWLPRELREQIYANLFFPNDDHIVVANDPQDFNKPHLYLDKTRKNNTSATCGYGLLAACRMTHVETVPLCYPTVRFVLVDRLASEAWLNGMYESNRLWMLKKVGIVILRRPICGDDMPALSLESKNLGELAESPLNACYIMRNWLESTEELSLHVDFRCQSLTRSYHGGWFTMFHQFWDEAEMHKFRAGLHYMDALQKLTVPGIQSKMQVIFPNIVPVELGSLKSFEIDTSIFQEVRSISSDYGLAGGDSNSSPYDEDPLFLMRINEMKSLTHLQAPMGPWMRHPVENYFALETLVLTNVWDLQENLPLSWTRTEKSRKVRAYIRAIPKHFGSTLKSLFIKRSPGVRRRAHDDVERAEDLSIWDPLTRALERMSSLTELSIEGRIPPNENLLSTPLGPNLQRLTFEIALDGAWAQNIEWSVREGNPNLSHLTLLYYAKERTKRRVYDFIMCRDKIYVSMEKAQRRLMRVQTPTTMQLVEIDP